MKTMIYRSIKPVSRAAKLIIAASALIVSTANATSPVTISEPELAGSTILIPLDGWYQVQNTTDYSTVCEGRISTCKVDDGVYLIVNHSTQQRWERFSVNTMPTPDVDVVVNGNTISWPDDGWYQVQDALTFESICQGGRYCNVENGTYIVINHVIAKRTTITVNEPDSKPETEKEFGVDGRFITFANDNWFQVQNANTYESVCEGQLSCLVAPGKYIVINHTTGTRYNDVYVNDDEYILRPTITASQCLAMNGQPVGDPGDGSVHQPEYRCSSGQPPVATVRPDDENNIDIEGSVCCL